MNTKPERFVGRLAYWLSRRKAVRDQIACEIADAHAQRLTFDAARLGPTSNGEMVECLLTALACHVKRESVPSAQDRLRSVAS